MLMSAKDWQIICKKYVNLQTKVKTYNHKNRLWENKGRDISRSRSNSEMKEFNTYEKRDCIREIRTEGNKKKHSNNKKALKNEKDGSRYLFKKIEIKLRKISQKWNKWTKTKNRKNSSQFRSV